MSSVTCDIRAEIGVVGCGDAPLAAALLHQPGEYPGAVRSYGAITRLLSSNRPFDVCKRKIRTKRAYFNCARPPGARAKVRAMDGSMPCTEFFDALEPTPADIDEVDVRRDEGRHRIGIVYIPCSLPPRCGSGDADISGLAGFGLRLCFPTVHGATLSQRCSGYEGHSCI